MSGIAGIIHFDGRPVEPGPIEKMTGAMAHRGLPQERLGTMRNIPWTQEFRSAALCSINQISKSLYTV